MRTIGIFGTSGFACEVEDIAHELGWRPIFVARTEADVAAWTRDEEVILETDVSRYAGMPFAIGIADTSIRQAVQQRFCDELRFVNLVHPQASFGKRQLQALESRVGVVVSAGVRFMSRISIGDFTAFDLNATIGHDCIVEPFAHVAPGANISGHVHIGARCRIGTGAVINQGHDGRKLTIGADTVIGSGAVVVRDCEASSVYVGCPARKVR